MLKLAASLLKQLDPDYRVTEDTDERIKLGAEERDWRPEHIEAAERKKAGSKEIMKETGIDYYAAMAGTYVYMEGSIWSFSNDSIDEESLTYGQKKTKTGAIDSSPTSRPKKVHPQDWSAVGW